MAETVTASVFMSGRSQAVRIPKAFQLTTKKVRIRKRGEDLVLTPVEEDQWAAQKELWNNMTDEDKDRWDELADLIDEIRRQDREYALNHPKDYSDWIEPVEEVKQERKAYEKVTRHA